MKTTSHKGFLHIFYDKNGYKVDNFNQSVNIMIECTCNIQERRKDGRNSFCNT